MPRRPAPCRSCGKPCNWGTGQDPHNITCRDCRRATPKPVQEPKTRPPAAKDNMHVCEACSNHFHTRETRPGQAKYCSHQCYVSNRTHTRPARPKSRKVYFPTCPTCDQIHATGNKRKNYCSDDCRYEARLAQLNYWYWYANSCIPNGEGRSWRNAFIWWMRNRDGDVCQICQDAQGPIQWDLPSGPKGHPSGLGPSIDHIIPKALGGTDHPDNLHLAHWVCNRERKTKPLPSTQMVIV